ncbi:hypothetical protein [Methylobacterium sp. E-045]|uniref:hypothetical protein n=1 Tax=Methylobacterium sp. E-045 TaxID=2836575 RepID=UPI001FB9C6E3|nr:hypothetical protein [Methylobacterium sp. E-045]MCJ2130791.1 hypothetical protein [Methylobacterium sp. E-045]
MARLRSPNYPALSLPAAIERVRTLHKVEGRNSTPREAIVKHLGFGSLNGASLTALSAISKYGLIDSTGDGEARVSDLAMRVIYPHDASERQAAIEEAAFRPALFQEIKDKWPDRPPSDESLKPYLVRKGFSEAALDQVIRFYRETIDIVQDGRIGHDSPSREPSKEEPMHTSSHAAAPAAPPQTSMTLPPGRPFKLAYDGVALSGYVSLKSTRDINKLIGYLNAQKNYIDETMEDEAFDEANETDQ